MKEANIKIIVCAHKADYCKSDDIYMPIHVGKALSNVDLGYIGDDTGDNISEKNRSFCELTGMYWAWKNLKNVDFIGLNHYRRYFYFRSNLINVRDLYFVANENTLDTNIVPNILEVLNKKQIILPRKIQFTKTVWDRWSNMRDENELIILQDIIDTMYPDYLKSYIKILKENNKVAQYCMFFMPWSVFDNYCKWLFSILFEAENRLNVIDRNYYESSRIYGFFAELLINVYVDKNDISVKYLPVLHICGNKNINIIRYIGSKIKTNIKYKFKL